MVVRNASILPGIAREIAALAQRRLDEKLPLQSTDIPGFLQLRHVLTDLLLRAWKTTQEVMNEGVEADMLRDMLVELREGVTSLLDTTASFRKLAGEEQTALEILTASESALVALHDEATKILDWLEAPLPPIDQARLERGIAQAERGEVMSAEDFLAQLRASEEP